MAELTKSDGTAMRRYLKPTYALMVNAASVACPGGHACAEMLKLSNDETTNWSPHEALQLMLSRLNEVADDGFLPELLARFQAMQTLD
jgi:hypothetical protein